MAACGKNDLQRSREESFGKKGCRGGVGGPWPIYVKSEPDGTAVLEGPQEAGRLGRYGGEGRMFLLVARTRYAGPAVRQDAWELRTACIVICECIVCMLLLLPPPLLRPALSLLLAWPALPALQHARYCCTCPCLGFF